MLNRKFRPVAPVREARVHGLPLVAREQRLAQHLPGAVQARQAHERQRVRVVCKRVDRFVRRVTIVTDEDHVTTGVEGEQSALGH